MKLLNFAAIAFLLSIGLNTTFSLQAQTYKISCNFKAGKNSVNPNRESVRDRNCLVTVPHANGQEKYQLEWSDKVKTVITITSRPMPNERRWMGEAVGLVDGYSAKIIKFSDGGICAEVLKSGNTICFR